MFQRFSHLDFASAQNGASIFTSLSAIIKTIGIVLLGYLSDKFKLYSTFAVLTPIILISSFLLSLFTYPTIPFILFGIGGALIQISLWTCLLLTIDENKAVKIFLIGFCL